MTLEDLGYPEDLNTYRKINHLEEFDVGRVISEHKERYIVKTQAGDYDSEITGTLRYTADNRSDFPAVGDWVALSVYDEDKALILAVFPRKTVIGRKAVGQYGEKQIIAANIDIAFIVQAVDRDFNINRMERYLTLCNESKIECVLILSKTDLVSETEVSSRIAEVSGRLTGVPVIAVSNQTGRGIDKLKEVIVKGRTCCLLGSSGVGKSTLINSLAGRPLMETGEINESIQRGRHVTSHRELIILENGGILIDNPGMREVGITGSSDGIDGTFDIIAELSGSCKFKNCTHTTETGCAVLEAVQQKRIDPGAYENYLKLERERKFFAMTHAEKRKREKDFGKMAKNLMKMKKREKR